RDRRPPDRPAPSPPESGAAPPRSPHAWQTDRAIPARRAPASRASAGAPFGDRPGGAGDGADRRGAGWRRQGRARTPRGWRPVGPRTRGPPHARSPRGDALAGPFGVLRPARGTGRSCRARLTVGEIVPDDRHAA